MRVFESGLGKYWPGVRAHWRRHHAPFQPWAVDREVTKGVTVRRRAPGEVLTGREGSGDLGLIGLGLGQFGIDLRLAAAEPAEQFEKLKIVNHAAMLAG